MTTVRSDASLGTEVLDAAPRHRARQGMHWWIASAVVALLGVMLIHMLVTSPNIHWEIISRYFLSSDVLRGLVLTLELTIGAMLMGIALGTVLAVMRLSSTPILSGTSWLYIWFFRGTPLLVQIIFWYNLAALVPRISFGIPFGPAFTSIQVNSIVTPLGASLLGLGLNEGAYMAEIIRSGIISVDHGQREAAQSIGLRNSQIMRKVVLPQAMRVIIPPTGNEVINMLKSSALVSVTSTAELLYSVQVIYNLNFQTIPLLIVASLWYLIVTTVLYVGQHYLEKRFGRGSARPGSSGSPSTLARWFRGRSMARPASEAGA